MSTREVQRQYTSEHVEQLRSWAHELGFHHFGVAPVKPPTRAFGFREWLDAGYAADMQWLYDRVEERLDPRTRFPWAESVLVVGLNYAHPLPEETPPDAVAQRVARYARGRDYHNVIPKRLRKLAKRIREELDPDAQCRYYADTGPFLEREYWAMSGIGWIGKHSLALTTDQGSWLLLGIMFTSLRLPLPLTLHPDRCGSCTRCLDACPTDAIVAPYRVDARACISYQTIENREDIPADIANSMEDWHFGCDICQEVCPWNREAPDGDPAFVPSEAMLTTSEEELLAMDRETFDERFRGSPVRRPKLAGMQRNVRASRRARGEDA